MQVLLTICRKLDAMPVQQMILALW